MKKTSKIVLITGALLVAGLAAVGPIMSQVEKPKYTVIEKQDNIEVRQYPSMIQAQVSLQGERKQAIQSGFRLLADYIFGNNTQHNKISMTAPVTQQDSEKIAMTAPVLQQSNEKITMTAPVLQQNNDAQWQVRFIMPSKYTLDTLPKPNNPKVRLATTPSKRYATIQFSGRNTNANIQQHEQLLKDYLNPKNLQAIANPIYAFYNPPWTLPFMRRNEILIEIKKGNNLRH